MDKPLNRMLPDRCKMPYTLWRVLEQLGLPPAMVLRQARLPATLHLNPEAAVTTQQLFAIWRAVEELSGDPDIAIRILEKSDTAGHSPMFLAACYASDFRDGLHRILRFKRLTSAEQLQLVEKNGELSIFKEWPHAIAPEPLSLVELSFAFGVALGRRGTGQHITPVRIEFTHQGPHSAARQAFFDCPIRYGAPRDVIVFRSADLDRPFPGYNLEMLDILTPALNAALSDPLLRSSFSEQVKSVLKRKLPSGRTEAGDVAQCLGTSERTLQRRIAEEGASFRSLLMEARRELSRELLSNAATGIDEVACLLGYQNTSSFYRAFRDWEGMTPAQWLARNGTKSPALALN
ncbi:MAG: AraC family transcriptional regulator [Proteobacteria bacterium]|nr:AraC family transcriptional regulator [Pseudomonadota bacterium]